MSLGGRNNTNNHHNSTHVTIHCYLYLSCFPGFRLFRYPCLIYMYIYIYRYTYIYMYIYIYVFSSSYIFSSPGGGTPHPPKTGIPESGALGPFGRASKRPPGPRRAFCQAFAAHLGRSGGSSETFWRTQRQHKSAPRSRHTPKDRSKTYQEASKSTPKKAPRGNSHRFNEGFW